MYKIGDIVKCTVTGFKNYGIFVSVDEEYTGLIHISEVSGSFVRNIEDYSEINEVIYAKVIGIDEENKHLKLSIKDIHYKIDGEDSDEYDKNGFKPLNDELPVWINEKLEELGDK